MSWNTLKCIAELRQAAGLDAKYLNYIWYVQDLLLMNNIQYPPVHNPSYSGRCGTNMFYSAKQDQGDQKHYI